MACLATACKPLRMPTASPANPNALEGAVSDDGFELMDDRIRINQIQLKGTHNSYHLKGDSPELAYEFAPLAVQLEEQGVRAFELDVHFNPSTNAYDVYHRDDDNKTSCATLAACLQEIAAWSDAHAHHVPIFIQIEPKLANTDVTEENIRLLDRTIIDTLSKGRVITPGSITGHSSSLRAALEEDGWPTLGEARGKFLFFVDDRGAFRDNYTHGRQDLSGRVMFADGDLDEDYVAVTVLNEPVADEDRISDAVDEGLIVRTRVDIFARAPEEREARRARALDSGAQILSTDYPVPGSAGAFTIPEGNPARCNSEGPSSCQGRHVEDPARL